MSEDEKQEHEAAEGEELVEGEEEKEEESDEVNSPTSVILPHHSILLSFNFVLINYLTIIIIRTLDQRVRSFQNWQTMLKLSTDDYAEQLRINKVNKEVFS